MHIPPATVTTDSSASGSGEVIPAVKLDEPAAAKDEIKIEKQDVRPAASQSHTSKRRATLGHFVWPFSKGLLMGAVLLAVLFAGFQMPNSLGSASHWYSKVSTCQLRVPKYSCLKP